MGLPVFEAGQIEGVAEGINAAVAMLHGDTFAGYISGLVPDFALGSSYAVDAFARSGSGQVYQCIARVTNATLDPTADPSHWQLMQFLSKPLMATGAGAGLIGFIRSEAGAVVRTLLQKGADLINVLDFGAVGDLQIIRDAAMTLGSVVLNTATLFTAADVDKLITVPGAGAAGANLVTSISSVAGGVPSLAIAAGTAVTGKVAYYGTDNLDAFNKATAAAQLAPGAAIVFAPHGNFGSRGAVGTNITLTGKVSIIGECKFTTTLTIMGTDDVVRVGLGYPGGLTAATPTVELAHFGIDGNAGGIVPHGDDTYCNGLNYEWAQCVHAHDLFVRNVVYQGIILQGAGDTTACNNIIERCIVTSCGEIHIGFEGGIWDSAILNNDVFRGGPDSIGISVSQISQDGFNNLVAHNRVSYIPVIGIDVTDGSDGARVVSNTVRACGTAAGGFGIATSAEFISPSNLLIDSNTVDACGSTTSAQIGVRCTDSGVRLRMRVVPPSVTQFDDGEVVTGSSTGATGRVISYTNGYLYLTLLSGSFTAAETLTGGTSGAHTTLSSYTYSIGGNVTCSNNILTRPIGGGILLSGGSNLQALGGSIDGGGIGTVANYAVSLQNCQAPSARDIAVSNINNSAWAYMVGSGTTGATIKPGPQTNVPNLISDAGSQTTVEGAQLVVDATLLLSASGGGFVFGNAAARASVVKNGRQVQFDLGLVIESATVLGTGNIRIAAPILPDPAFINGSGIGQCGTALIEVSNGNTYLGTVIWDGSYFIIYVNTATSGRAAPLSGSSAVPEALTPGTKLSAHCCYQAAS